MAAALGVWLWFGSTGVYGHGDATETLGVVDFPISCNADAQRHFNRAMAMYHSFYWSQANVALDGVIKADPSCGMAHWARALVLMDNPFLWPRTGEALPAGLAAIERAKASVTATPREREYFSAVEQFFKDHERRDHRSRAEAYERAMRQLSIRYPSDVEAAVLFGLVLSANFDPADKTYAKQLEAAGVLEGIFKKHPEHPGAAHYLIHSYDYPPLAERGREAALRYAKIAASAPHALHMPSHIFTRLGYWQESVESNLASVKSSDKDIRSRFHGRDYLAYAYLQIGQDLEVGRLVGLVNTFNQSDGDNFPVAYALAAIPARFALERGRWQEAAALPLRPDVFDYPWQRFPQAEAINAFARGLGAARSGDTVSARREIERLTKLGEDLHSVGQAYWAEQSEIQAKVVLAWTAWASGDRRGALAQLRAAADQEDATEKNVISPGPLAPARELLGEMLLDNDEPVAALREFQAGLRKEPNRFRSLYGAGAAAEQQGAQQEARAYYARLVENAARSDSNRAEIKHAKRYLERSGSVR